MSLRAWAIKPSELKAVEAEARVPLLVRWAKRVEPWIHESAMKPYRRALAVIARGEHDEALADELEGLGAIACDRLDGTDDEALGRCHNYATLAVGFALKPMTTKDLVDMAKNIGSIPAVLAHAGLVKAPKGRDAVEFAATQMWAALRSDIHDSASP